MLNKITSKTITYLYLNVNLLALFFNIRFVRNEIFFNLVKLFLDTTKMHKQLYVYITCMHTFAQIYIHTYTPYMHAYGHTYLYMTNISNASRKELKPLILAVAVVSGPFHRQVGLEFSVCPLGLTSL